MTDDSDQSLPLSNPSTLLRRWRWVIGLIIAAAVVGAIAFTILSRPEVVPVQFNLSGVAMGGIPSHPNQTAAYSAPLDSSTKARITLVRIALIPFPGFPTPTLTHVALLARGGGYPTGTTGWPPGAGTGEGVFAISKLSGTVIDSHTAHKLPPVILYGVVGPKPGVVYAVLGVRVTYRFRDKVYSTNVYSGASDCVTQYRVHPSKAQLDHCDAVFKRLTSIEGSLPMVKSYFKT